MPARKPRKTKHASADVLDSHEAAWLLGVHVETLRRLARKSEIPSYKVGKDWRFSKESLCAWMETHHSRQQPLRALVVDAESEVRGRIGLLLEQDGYRVALAGSGECAIASARRQMPDVVLLDLVMPGTSSIETLKALHAMDRDVPVIIVADHPDSALLTEALRYPPVTLLPKPPGRAVLLGSVRRVLEGARRRGQETA